MINRISFREILAWITLAAAFVLLSVSIAFAQNRTISVENDDGKVHLKISKMENGKSVKIDTTFALTDEMDLENIINELSGDDDVVVVAKSKKEKDGRVNKKKIVIDLDIPEFSEEEKEKIRKEVKESMKDFDKSMNELSKSLKNMHIYMGNDEDGKDHDFKFDFDIPEIDIHSLEDCINRSYSYSYSYKNDDEMDSLDDGEHFIIMGNENETPPVLEKVITSKNGKQVFVYKRSIPQGKDDHDEEDSDEENKSSRPDLKDIKYYPNPSNGKFKLSFRSEVKNDFTITILDSNSKEVYSERLNDFQGEYTKDIDISKKSKGSYLLKISQGKKSFTQKIVVN